MLGHGTETIALFTGDALGGLINASLGNATELIIAILLLFKCEIRVVQASLLVRGIVQPSVMTLCDY